jgi:hypothetical protein
MATTNDDDPEVSHAQISERPAVLPTHAAGNVPSSTAI